MGAWRPGAVCLGRWALARCLAAVPLNQVAYRRGGLVLKRRLPYAGLLIALAGPWLPGSRVLARAEWAAYEPAVFWRIYGRPVVHHGAGLCIPRLPGATLAATLRHPAFSAQQRLEAFAAALQALRRLHTLVIAPPGGAPAPFSHADATVRNVLYDPRDTTARWFDFETIHDPRMPAALRHADDLYTLVCSAAALLPAQLYPALAALVAEAADTQTYAALLGLLERPAARLSVFRLAQTGAGPRVVMRLASAFRSDW
jgi:hypothetical protein